MRATATTRSITAAHPELRAFWAELRASDPPAGVVNYSLGDVTRDQQGQNAALASGASEAAWGQSPHNFSPALALDIYPIVMDRPGHIGSPAVSTKSADYLRIRQIAESRGLTSGGGWTSPDWPHVEITGWRDLTDDDDDTPAPVQSLVLMAVAAVGVALILWGTT